MGISNVMLGGKPAYRDGKVILGEKMECLFHR